MKQQRSTGLLWFERLLWFVASLTLLIAIAYGGVVWFSSRMLARQVVVPVNVEAVAVPAGDQAAILRGNYLVDHLLGCRACHAEDLGGRAEVDNGTLGTFWAPNLTAGIGSVILDYELRDWTRAIRHGVGRDGRRLLVMPSQDFQTLGDDDVAAVVAAVQAAPAVDRANRGVRLGPLGRVLLVSGQLPFAFDVIDHSRPRPVVSPSPTPAWGKVLAGACVGCHGTGYSGGPIHGGDPSWPPARNLTPHETGLKDWSLGEFTAAFRTGKRPDGSVLSEAMPWRMYAGMTDADVAALFLFFQALDARPAGNH